MEDKNCQKVVILLGPPGSGKGTQADFLSEKLGFFHFETSKIIKEKFKTGDADPNIDMEQEKILHYKGKLNTPWIVSKWVKEKVEELYKNSTGIVFDGSPRTLEEAEKMEELLQNTYGLDKTIVFYVNVPEEELIDRLSRRLLCERCGKTVSVAIHESIEECQKCGGKLVRRKLDDLSIVPTRLKEYKERTYPVVEYFKQRKISLFEINGSRSIKEASDEIISHVLKCRQIEHR